MERDQRAVYIFQKVPILPYPSDSPMAKYTALLTPFAMSYLATQMSHSASVTIVRDMDDDSHTVEVQSSEGLLTRLAGTSLLCVLRSELANMLLLYVAVQWTKSYYERNQRVFVDNPPVDDDWCVAITEASRPQTERLLAGHERYKHAFQIAQKIAGRAAEFLMREFQYALTCLEEIIEVWDRGGRVVVTEVQDNDGRVSLISS